MIQITVTTNKGNEHREVRYQGVLLKSYDPNDDYAYTKASAYAQKLRIMQLSEFKEKFPEFFL